MRGTKRILFSSKKMERETPRKLFCQLNQYWKFTTDVCATSSNAKVAHYFTPEDDGLSQEWRGVCWMNPPYGREIGKWVEKAYRSVQGGGCIVVALLPARVDTRWFHDWIYNKPGVKINFIRGRLRFGDAVWNAPFPCMTVVFKSKTSPQDNSPQLNLFNPQ